MVCQEKFITKTTKLRIERQDGAGFKGEIGLCFAATAVRKTVSSWQLCLQLNDKYILTQVDLLKQEELHSSENVFSLK